MGGEDQTFTKDEPLFTELDKKKKKLRDSRNSGLLTSLMTFFLFEFFVGAETSA